MGTSSPDLRDRREAAGLSQEALARRADCSTKMVALLESGYRPGRSETLARIERVLREIAEADAA